MGTELVLWIVVGTALAFDFTNGFHDTANSVATSISTRAMSPRVAVALAAVLNFVGAFLSLAVAATIASGIVGVVGAALAAEGPKAVYGDGLIEKVMIPALVAPVLALTTAGIGILLCYRIVGRQHPGVVSRGFRLGQIVSGSLFSLSHGTNDAQKTMGIIALALIASGHLDSGADPPTWVVVSAATAIALGTYVGGWRIIRTMGSRIIKMDPAQGFSAQTGGAAVLLTAAHLGFPLSTTHVISGAIMGAGAAKRISAVRWGLAGNIAVAWVLTLPAAAIVGGLTYGVTRIFGDGAAGPVVVTAVLLALLGWVFTRRLAGGRTLTAEG